ncbi:dihydropteroate synthase [Kwoniella sp. DSM 27419]
MPSFSPHARGGPAHTRDSVNLSSLSIHLPNGLGPSAFNLIDPAPPCPILLDLSFALRPRSIEDTAAGDVMSGLGVNYSAVSKAIYALVSSTDKTWQDPWSLMEAVSGPPQDLDDCVAVQVKLTVPRALLHADAAVYSARYSQGLSGGLIEEERRCMIKDIRTECIIGLHPHERQDQQRLEVDVEVTDIDWKSWNHKAFTDEVHRYVSASSYGTIESLIHELGRHLFASPLLARTEARLSINIRKPSAIPFATPSISIHRVEADYRTHDVATTRSTGGYSSTGSTGTRVIIAVGSNIGDRVDHIHRAVKMLEDNGCRLLDCSWLYESEPMYVEDQDRFVNGAIELSTSLQPLDLLQLLKRTEKTVGRTKTFTNGPRVIDLDLVFYGTEVVRIGSREDEEDEYGVRWLECPHASLAEREFVLRPVADIAPDFTHPSLRKTVKQLLGALPPTETPALQPIIPFSGSAKPLRLSIPATPHIMAVFNATPDSFSDGDAARTEVTHALGECERLLDGPYPPAILDIGGMSTRPKAVPCTEEEELSRVVPLIRAIRASGRPDLFEVPISIDTYRPNVARAAIQAGASCINDVRGGREPGMMEAMAELNVPVVLMHSRGDSTSMTSAESQDYSAQGGVVRGVIQELADTVRTALKAGVKRWNIILDPGLGFAKNQEDNLRLLKSLDSLVQPGSPLAGYPVLVGGSRKGFVGRVIEQEVASQRGFGDAALNAWCVSSGVVDVLRVHAPREASETVRMAAAIRDVK